MQSTPKLNIQPLGEAAFTVTLAEAISAEASTRVLALRQAILAADLPGVRGIVPAYTSLLVRFDPDRTVPSKLLDVLTELCRTAPRLEPEAGRLVEVPVIYGGIFGPDLGEVSDHTGMTATEVIQLHTAGEYTVAFLGFLPGFPYLIGMDPRLACPRLATPRQTVPAGSVGIAGGQTGIYPLESPGGWRIIGRTSLKLFDPAAVQPTLFQAGDRVRFTPIKEGAAL